MFLFILKAFKCIKTDFKKLLSIYVTSASSLCTYIPSKPWLSSHRPCPIGPGETAPIQSSAETQRFRPSAYYLLRKLPEINTHVNLPSIHLDLLNQGHIKDPFIGQNEADVQWVP